MNTPRCLPRLAALTLGLLLCLRTVAATPPPLPTATPESVGMSGARLDRLDHYIEQQIAAGRTAGGVVLIARRGRIVHFRAMGAADLATHRPMRTDDWFRLFSMTKPVTATALLTLYEQGKFQLTDPLSKYLPAFKDVRVSAGKGPNGELLLEQPKRPITIQDVVRHSAGFSYGYFGDSEVDKAYREGGVDYFKSDSVGQLTERLARMPLAYQPGARFQYSFAHDVQAALIEVLSGMPVGEYCRKAIFLPLGMQDTAYGVPGNVAARFPTAYSANPDGGLVPTANPERYAHFTDRPMGGVGLSSTPADYLRFAQMLRHGGELGGVRIRGRRTVQMMTTDQLGDAGIAEGYPGYGFGLGVGVLTNPVRNGNLSNAGQFGWSGIATTTVLIDPKEQLVALYFEQYLPEDRDLLDYFTTLVYQALVD